MDPKSRFSNRVEAYVAARPSYPSALLEWMRDRLGLEPTHAIADIGSGTGLLSKLFLDAGITVIGVEPNEAMRAAGNRFLAGYPSFRSVAGSAEASTLPDTSVDFITAGQAFHWFDPILARREFERIVRPGCWAVLVWNESRAGSTPLAREYEQLKQRYMIDPEHPVHHNSTDANMETFFGAAGYQMAEFLNPCRYSLEQLRQRAASSSYLPAEGHPDFEPMMRDLTAVFARHAEPDGTIAYDHDTRAYYAQIKP